MVHHLVARDGVEDGNDGKLVFGADEVTHQGEIAAEASSERHIVAVAGFEVGVAHVRGIGIDIVFEGVELIVVGACNAAGVAEAKTFHHVGGVVARIECGEKVEIVLCDGVGGVIGVGVFAAQTCLDGPALVELAGKGGIEGTDVFGIVEWVVNRAAVNCVIAPILTTYNLVEHIVGMRQSPLGTRLHHKAAQHHALVVEFGTVDVDDVVVVEGEVLSRVESLANPHHRRKDGQIIVVLNIVGGGTDNSCSEYCRRR